MVEMGWIHPVFWMYISKEGSKKKEFDFIQVS